jgi:hypothetical protein
MEIPIYFWPFLPVTGSQKTTEALSGFCERSIGAKLHVVTEKMEYKEKAQMVMKDLEKA